MHCKAKMLKKSNRAFRAPANSNFVAAFDAEKMDLSGSPLMIILRNLPAYHRFIYVMDAVAEYSAAEIGRIFSTSPKVIEKALEAESVNIERIVTAAKKKNKDLSVTVDSFRSSLMKDAESITVRNAVDAIVRMKIDEICEPLQKREKRKRIGIFSSIAAVLVVVALIIGVSIGGGENSDVDLDNADQDTTLSTDADGSISESDESEINELADSMGDTTLYSEATHYADIVIEDYGTITVALDGNAAPETVANFVSLAEEGFYDGLTFHRIIEGFMMQGGDPNGDGTGGSDKTIFVEFSANGFENDLSHYRGAISMARSNDYDSASSQFFIVHEDNLESLDGLYACFGYVEEGMDIVDAFCAAAEDTDGNGLIAADKQPVITTITIREVADDADGSIETNVVEGTGETDESDDSDSVNGSSDTTGETTSSYDGSNSN